MRNVSASEAVISHKNVIGRTANCFTYTKQASERLLQGVYGLRNSYVIFFFSQSRKTNGFNSIQI